MTTQKKEKTKGGSLRKSRRSRHSKRVKTRLEKTPKSLKKEKQKYFKPGNRLTEEQKRYCRCVYHVAAKQPPKCLLRRAWGDKCYNPYAVCSKSTKRQGRIECFKNTKLENMPIKEQKALAALKKLTYGELLAK